MIAETVAYQLQARLYREPAEVQPKFTRVLITGQR